MVQNTFCRFSENYRNDSEILIREINTENASVVKFLFLRSFFLATGRSVSKLNSDENKSTNQNDHHYQRPWFAMCIAISQNLELVREIAGSVSAKSG